MLWNSFKIFLWRSRDVLLEEKIIEHHWSKHRTWNTGHRLSKSLVLYIYNIVLYFFGILFLEMFFVLLAKTCHVADRPHLVESLFKKPTTFLKKSEGF